MTREEAYIWNENSHDENFSTVREMEESIHYLLKKIYDNFEVKINKINDEFSNRSCKNCKFGMTYLFDDEIECFKIEAETQGTYFSKDFSCNKWEKNES